MKYDQSWMWKNERMLYKNDLPLICLQFLCILGSKLFLAEFSKFHANWKIGELNKNNLYPNYYCIHLYWIKRKINWKRVSQRLNYLYIRKHLYVWRQKKHILNFKFFLIFYLCQKQHDFTFCYVPCLASI